jgi:hypothetical protein
MQSDPHTTGDWLLGAQDIGVEVSTVTREPFALIDESRVFLGDRGFETRYLAIEDQILEGSVRRVQDDRRRRLIDLA